MELPSENTNTPKSEPKEGSKYQSSQRIDKLKDQLNSRNTVFNIKPRTDLNQNEHGLKSSWGNTEQKEGFAEQLPKEGIGIFAKITLIALIFFIGAVGFAAFNFYGGNGPVSATDVDITVVGPVSIGGGEELVLDVIVQNNNSSVLETVDLIIEYPNGTKNFEDTKKDLLRLRDGLGDIQPGSVVKRTYSAVLFGEEGSKQDIEVRAEYRLPNSNAIFEKKKIFDVVLQSSPIRVKVDTVKEITAGQEFDFNIEISSNSTKVLNNIMVVADFPFGFTLDSTNFENTFGDGTWIFETLDPGEVVDIELKGRLEGQNNEERVFEVKAGISDKDDPRDLGIVFSTLFKSLTIQKPFFGVDIEFDRDSSGELVKKGEKRVNAQVVYTNNLNDPILDAKIKLQLTGAVLDKSSVDVSRGFYNSSDNTITWDSSTNQNFAQLDPRTEGTVSFSFESKDLGTASDIFRNPEIGFDALVTGRRVGDNSVEEEIESNTLKKIRFYSDVTVVSQSTYGIGAFQNSGPIPPVAEQETTYTIKWQVANSSNNLVNAKVVANLPQYVKWNAETSPSSSDVAFDPVNRQVVWTIGNLSEGVGYTSGARTMSFQVTFDPSVSQIGQTPELITNTTFRAQDTFTKTTIEETISDTSIRAEDFIFQIGSDKVVE
jgi:hypothetical protein